jgi:23S rRNA (cytidine1920-2'-O)/16S rRNA (cytidine1409-2'-O)-methyltransferase
LVRRGLVDSRAAAQRAIEDGLVVLAGVPATKAATLVDDSVSLKLAGDVARFVSRGGDKLDGALTSFPVEVAGRRAIDVGASTGGFTDCLLQRGAASVAAVDVGYGQIDWKLRNDARVSVVERCNIRHADPAELGAPFDLVVADLSFISLRTVAAALAGLGGDQTDHVYLVKPQFEVGKGELGKGGIVRDDEARATAVGAVIDSLAAVGLGTHGLIRSPITGAKGNIELLAWLRPGPTTVDPTVIDEVAR